MTGKITQVLPEKNGTSARGPWRKQEYVIELPGDFPKQVCFMVWGDRIDQYGIREGKELTVSFDLESREFNGRWYTDVKAWRVAPSNSGEPGGEPFRDEPPPFDEEPPF
ncbi:MAG: DUF3127 domain-containing protein [Chromatiaceae bacterium]|nr:DUF3127 domain-containing protein [Chromatiaceae bacterium]MCF8016793.1 DUF3127 domain-containing protein [Chromatiaceae bacterium]